VYLRVALAPRFTAEVSPLTDEMIVFHAYVICTTHTFMTLPVKHVHDTCAMYSLAAAPARGIPAGIRRRILSYTRGAAAETLSSRSRATTTRNAVLGAGTRGPRKPQLLYWGTLTQPALTENDQKKTAGDIDAAPRQHKDN